MPSKRDVVVVGAGPNGLAAALTLQLAGRSVLVLEAAETVGGGARTEELTLPGVRHDVCSTVHPLALASPFFRDLPLEALGVEWAHPPIPLAHPLDDGSAVRLRRSVHETADGLGSDGAAYRRLVGAFVDGALELADDVLAPRTVPRHPLLLARFGRHAVRSAEGLASRFRTPGGRALLAGLAAHSILPLDAPVSGGIGLFLGTLGHAVGWPFARGGSAAIPEALAARLRAVGGEIVTGRRVETLAELPRAESTVLDLTPRQVATVGGGGLPPASRRDLEGHEHGPGAFKMDWALDGPIPWRAEGCAEAGTVHLGGTFEEIASAEHEVAAGRHSERPFVLLSQPTVADPSRSPEGTHVAWAYCHVPNGSERDMSDPIEAQIERFAPGFRDRILARHAMGPADLERHDANLVGGDVAAGRRSPLRTALGRRVGGSPYATRVPGLFLCSAATPPGPGVHGMCGHLAASELLRHDPRET